MASINTEVYVGYIDVDVDLEDFDTEDLREELERRGGAVVSSEYISGLLQQLYEKRRNGRDYEHELDQLIYESIGRM